MRNTHACPICLSVETLTGPSLKNLPVAHVISLTQDLTDRDFGELVLNQCTKCHHLWNSAAISEQRDFPPYLTNRPVSTAMKLRHSQLVSELHSFQKLRVLDVGAGSGAIANGFALKGHSVTAVDPQLAYSSLLEVNSIRTFPSLWPVPELLQEQFDLVLCVQVLEHTTNPYEFLSSLLNVVSTRGFVYVEVPSGDWILQHGSIIDLHLAHIQYFSELSFCTMIETLGYSVVSKRSLLGGRDVGYLVQQSPTGSYVSDTMRLMKNPQVNFELLVNSSLLLHRNLAQIQGSTAVYGANGGSQSLFGWSPEGPWELILDDTKEYWGSCGYSIAGKLPIAKPTAEMLQRFDNILIASYIHDVGIYEKIDNSGYRGSVYSLRPSKSVSEGPRSIFA